MVSEIDIPGNPTQTYKFNYTLDPSGQLSKITFPDGGYVEYTWGSAPKSQYTYQVWTPQANDTEFCYALVDMPAITERKVSRDGSTIAHDQKFAYSPATVVTSNSAPPYWSQKTTTVTDTDMVANQTQVTTYTYVPTTTVIGPNDTSWQILETPVEQQITYADGSGKLYKTLNKSWLNRFVMVGQQTILNGDTAHGVTVLNCPDTYNRILATYEYDYPQTNGTAGSFPACAAVSSLASGLPDGAAD